MQFKEIMGALLQNLCIKIGTTPTSEPCRMDEMWVRCLGGVGENKSVGQNWLPRFHLGNLSCVKINKTPNQNERLDFYFFFF
jgi:hypothetical protein